MKKLLLSCLTLILTLWVAISPALAEDKFVCTQEGFFGDPTDCTKFHRCVDYEQTGEKFTIFNFDCGEGTIFDESLSVCNHPWAVSPPPPCMENYSQSTSSNDSAAK